MLNQIEMPTTLRQYLREKMIGKRIEGYLISKVLGVGNTAVTYEVEDEYFSTWALKIVTRESYEHAPFTEVARFSRVKDTRYLVFPKESGEWKLKLHKETHEFIWFRSRCVNGITLREFLESKTYFSPRSEITRYMENITIAIEELERFGFSHGDLHDRNIMREVIGEDSISPEIRYVIIDFSEAHSIKDPNAGISKDIENFGKHLLKFSDVLYRRDTLSRDDEKILDAMRHIPGLLNGINAETAAITKPSEIFQWFKQSLINQESGSRGTLNTPFDSLNTENIANDALLADLCFMEMWWTSELEKNRNVLFLGPRGCGKTMIFRRLRMKTKISAKKFEEFDSDRYIGFYLPCESIFYMRFSDLSGIDVESYKDALILFFNMSILSEISSTLFSIPQNLFVISLSVINQIIQLVKEELGEIWDILRFPHTLSSFDEIVNQSESVMRYIRKNIAYGIAIKAKGSTDFLNRLVKIVKAEVPELSGKYFTFFLDDFTEERVPLPLQEALHPIVCQRSPDLCFKISAHMFGSIYSYPRPLALDEGRNIVVINLGTAYLSLDKRAREGKLLIKILNERFRHCKDYNGTIEEWLGNTSYPGGRTISWALHDNTTRNKFYYHGVECLMDLCTGDYSEMIRMVGKIFEEAGIKGGETVAKIDNHIQDRVIKRVSREHLDRIRYIRPDGDRLFEIIKSFGQLSKDLLYEKEPVGQGKNREGKQRKDPYDLLTIYVDDLQAAFRSYRDIWKLLQKASIFVDIGVAPSQRCVIADRVTLRRIYSPAFKTTLTSSEHLQLTKKQFEGFIDKPGEFCLKYFKRVTKKEEIKTLFLWEDEKDIFPEADIEITKEFQESPLPDVKYVENFSKMAPKSWHDLVTNLPEIKPIEEVIKEKSKYNLYIGAMGFEERTTGAIELLAKRGVEFEEAVLFEFDMYFGATEKRRKKYHSLIKEITKGNPHRPMHAPVSSPDISFPERFADLLNAIFESTENRKILFDCTSCPASIHSQTLAVLLKKYDCDLTILYSEAEEYYPLKDEWDSGRVKPRGKRVEGPFEGFRFISKPTILQSDDSGERPILLILFPTYNTERTDGVLAYVDPTERIWIFGEPHHEKNSYRIDMAKLFSSPIMHPSDKWSLVSTFDYKDSMLSLGGIYHKNRFNYRMVTMPHGSKMQILGVNLFGAIHQISLVYAMPKSYAPDRYSKGCLKVWAVPLGSTKSLISYLKSGRVIGGMA